MEVWAKTGSGLGRWLGFVTAVWVQCISGNNYTFSNYSDALKSLMGLTQLELNNLSVAKDVGKAFGLLAGLASDRLPTPLILLIGALEGLIGYGAQWLVVRQSIAPLPYWQMCVFLCMGGNSTTWMNTAVLVTCMRNFRRNRGPVSGILKGYVGLSTAIFTDLCSALFADNPASFLLMLAVVPAVVCTAAMLFLHESPASAGDDETDTKYFGAINAMAVVIAVYLLVFDLTGDHGTAVSRVFAAVLLVLLATPVAVPIYVAFKARSKNPDVEDGQIQEPLLIEEAKEEPAAATAVAAAEAAAENGKRGPAIGEDHTILEAVKTVDFWILFISFLCGVGTGLAVMNNMGQMGLALGYTDVSIFVSMTSIWGFFGRIGSGSISEYFLKKTAIPRPLWNAASHRCLPRILRFCFAALFVSLGSKSKVRMGSDMKVYTLAEVSKHNSNKDCWLIIGGKVYDVTKFLEDHPGGDEVLLSATGKDATDDFEDVGHSTTARAMMDEYHVGEIDASTIPSKVKYTPPKQPHYNQDKTSDFIIKLLQFLVPLAILGLAVAIRIYTKSA